MISYKTNFKFHQVLHGYSDGHRLLSSSISFAPDTDRLLFVMSDMSGPSMSLGFERYLTGYPLPTEESYALAMTWYAPEMRRPGCVYTHTILIKNQDLPYIRNFLNILGLFRRPKGNDDLEFFKETLELIDIESSVTNVLVTLPVINISKVIDSVYSHPGKPIFVAEESTEAWENTFLQIWSQQWPKLMRNFSFCTGALTSRRISGHHLDLQHVPWSYVNQLHREVPEGIIVGIGDSNPCKGSDWVSFLVKDVCWPDKNFRQFIRKFGVESDEGRILMPLLARTYIDIYLCNDCIPSIENIILDTCRIFPSVNQGKKFKKAIFGLDGLLSNVMSEDEILCSTVTSKYNKCLPPILLRIKERAANLYLLNPQKCIEISISILNDRLNKVRNEFIVGVFSAVNDSDAILFANEFKGILPTLLTYNSNLLSYVSIWSLSGISRQEVLAEAKVNGFLNNQVLSAIIHSGSSDDIASELTHYFEKDAIIAALNYQNTTNDFIGWNWVAAFRNYNDVLTTWILSQEEINATVIAILANSLLDDAHTSDKLPLKCWSFLANNLNLLGDRDLYIGSVGYLAMMAFSGIDVRYSGIMACVFQPVHDLAANNEINYNIWQRISRYLPSVGLKEWDRCEKLRKGLVEKYIECNWPIQNFLSSVQSKETLSKILDLCVENRVTRRFVRNIRSAVKRGNVTATKTQIALLENVNLSKKSWLSFDSNDY